MHYFSSSFVTLSLDGSKTGRPHSLQNPFEKCRALYAGKLSNANLVLVQLVLRRKLPENTGLRFAARFPKLLPQLRPKSAIFPTPFMTQPNIRYPIYTWPLNQYPVPDLPYKFNSSTDVKGIRAFDDGLDNDEKEACKKNTILNWTLELKDHTG